MHMSTLIFTAMVVLFLLGLIVSAVRINVMSELDEVETSDESLPLWDLSAGVAESSGDAIDGQQ